MKTNFRILLTLFKLISLCVITFLISSCTHVRNDKFGKDYNVERVKLGLPIIKEGWTLKQGSMYDGAIFYPGPKDHATWFTNNRTKDKTLPYYAYKTIYFSGDTLIAERDTYLNSYFNWFNNEVQIKDSTDTIKKAFEKYHALDIIYVYRQLDTSVKSFSSYSLGFNYEIQGVKDGLSDRQILSRQEAEEILKRWNLKRLNY